MYLLQYVKQSMTGLCNIAPMDGSTCEHRTCQRCNFYFGSKVNFIFQAKQNSRICVSHSIGLASCPSTICSLANNSVTAAVRMFVQVDCVFQHCVENSLEEDFSFSLMKFFSLFIQYASHTQ